MEDLEHTLTLEFEENRYLLGVYGRDNQHLRLLEQRFNVSISQRGNQLFIAGGKEDTQNTKEILSHLYNQSQKGAQLEPSDVEMVADKIKGGVFDASTEVFIKTRKKTIAPRTINQQTYIEKMLSHDLVFGIGPAGTGKTFLAVALAVSKLIAGVVSRIIISRPAVEAGEKIGFLPGDMKDKVDPYLRPIYDALNEFLTPEEVQKKTELGEIEIAPIAFMRGRTFSNAFVIVDEAQNMTPIQMKMLLTRLGQNSRMVINGDISQVDLPHGQVSGLEDALHTLKYISEIGFMTLTQKDIVRHALVSKIVVAYDSKNR